MLPDDPLLHPALRARDVQRHQATTSLTVAMGRAQLLQRRIQRAEGLSVRERADLLRDVAVILAEVRRLIDHVQTLVAGEE